MYTNVFRSSRTFYTLKLYIYQVICDQNSCLLSDKCCNVLHLITVDLICLTLRFKKIKVQSLTQFFMSLDRIIKFWDKNWNDAANRCNLFDSGGDRLLFTLDLRVASWLFTFCVQQLLPRAWLLHAQLSVSLELHKMRYWVSHTYQII